MFVAPGTPPHVVASPVRVASPHSPIGQPVFATPGEGSPQRVPASPAPPSPQPEQADDAASDITNIDPDTHALKPTHELTLRVRPASTLEQSSESPKHEVVVETDGDTVKLKDPHQILVRSWHLHDAKVCGSDTEQDEVVAGLTEGLIGRALQGAHPLILLYGAENTGKPELLEGASHRIMQRALRVLSSVHDDVTSFSVNVSCSEINSEIINDFLNASGRNLLLRVAPSKRNDAHMGTFVDGLAWVTISDVEDGMFYVRNALRKLSLRGGRSHAIVSIEVHSHLNTDQHVTGTIRLVQLASSDAQIKGIGHKRGLSALESVFTDTANDARHVRYRDSKLTHLLQDSLDTTSNTPFVRLCATVSPTAEGHFETQRTLNFIERIKGLFLPNYSGEAKQNGADVGQQHAAGAQHARGGRVVHHQQHARTGYPTTYVRQPNDPSRVTAQPQQIMSTGYANVWPSYQVAEPVSAVRGGYFTTGAPQPAYTSAPHHLHAHHHHGIHRHHHHHGRHVHGHRPYTQTSSFTSAVPATVAGGYGRGLRTTSATQAAPVHRMPSGSAAAAAPKTAAAHGTRRVQAQTSLGYGPPSRNGSKSATAPPVYSIGSKQSFPMKPHENIARRQASGQHPPIYSTGRHNSAGFDFRSMPGPPRGGAPPSGLRSHSAGYAAGIPQAAFRQFSAGYAPAFRY